MGTKRVPISRKMRRQVSPAAVQIWRTILEIQAQPRNDRGELCEENRVALRDAMAELAHVVGFSKFELEPSTVPDEPWPWVVATGNSVQLERWQQSKEIRDALNRALLAETRP
jgi:hypothetical protein